ncbi:Cof-type HAD-IIB family hydrolase [Lacticaseibacillus parakribbianus]|uniref:Cof-type HAD-IIB family hydrolase n=1 Tax=Lacticaseibacillus parakribbianus TaxID=2970927 RepID=UPI0021CB1CD6|nr:Cof-type HAD-IIB family hydrolase [Lacticaseibacillus parakribbianus]
MIRLIATDMDGTFLSGDGTYDNAAFARLHERMQAQGVRFVVASGNQFSQLASFFPAYPDLLYVAENGAYLRTVDRELAVHAFAPAATAAILAVLADFPELQVLVCGRRSAYAGPTVTAAHVAEMRRYYHHLAVVPDVAQVADDVLKFALSCPPQRTEALVAALSERLVGWAVAVSSGHGDIDLIQPGVHKAAGLRELGAMLGIDLAEMAAFGDGGNDLEMIQAVGLGVAMANAQPAVLAAAKDQAASNEAQGVLRYIDQHLLK